MHVFPAFPDWVLFLAGVVCLVGVIMLVQGAFARKRTRELTTAAMEIGFNFEGEDWLDQQQAPHMETALFRRGHGQEHCNIMTGSSAGLRASLFDYEFTVGHGRGSQTHKQTIAAYSKSGIILPEFEMQPEGILQKIGDAFVHKDIDFDSHPEFSRRYQLRSPEADKTRELFTPGLLSFLEALDFHKKWRLEGVAETLYVYRMDKRAKPTDLRMFLEESTSIASSFFSLCGLKKSPF